MTAEQRELFRHGILQVLEANNSSFGLPAAAISLHLRSAYGFASSTTADVRAELDYLADKGLVTRVNKLISPENAAWRITAQGRDYIAT